PRPLDPATGQAAAVRHAKHGPGRVQANQAQLIRTIEACQKRGVECILVSIPTHPCYRDHLLPEYRAETSALIREVCRQTGAIYCDYAADPRFGDTDFYDGDHLNEGGAIKFTRLLDESVLR